MGLSKTKIKHKHKPSYKIIRKPTASPTRVFKSSKDTIFRKRKHKGKDLE